MHKELNTDAILAGINPINITEYTMVSDRVAKVIVNSSIEFNNKSAVTSSIIDLLGGNASPIEASFTWLRPNQSMIGFVATTRVTREYNPAQIRAKYRTIASNIYMDSGDETLWEMKEGAGGKYLARQGHDDLSSLIESSRVSPRGSTPRMASVISASAQSKEFVAFVYDKSEYSMPSVEYGFCIAETATTSTILCSSTKEKLVVSKDALISAHAISSKELHSAILATRKVKADSLDVKTMEDYYRQAYSYAPEYVQLIIDQIEQMRAM